MAKTKRVQVLMDPEEFRVLARLARQRRSSVSDLMREAARAQLLAAAGQAARSDAAQTFLGLPDVKLPAWKELKREIEDRFG